MKTHSVSLSLQFLRRPGYDANLPASIKSIAISIQILCNSSACTKYVHNNFSHLILNQSPQNSETLRSGSLIVVVRPNNRPQGHLRSSCNEEFLEVAQLVLGRVPLQRHALLLRSNAAAEFLNNDFWRNPTTLLPAV